MEMTDPSSGIHRNKISIHTISYPNSLHISKVTLSLRRVIHCSGRPSLIAESHKDTSTAGSLTLNTGSSSLQFSSDSDGTARAGNSVTLQAAPAETPDVPVAVAMDKLRKLLEKMYASDCSVSAYMRIAGKAAHWLNCLTGENTKAPSHNSCNK